MFERRIEGENSFNWTFKSADCFDPCRRLSSCKCDAANDHGGKMKTSLTGGVIYGHDTFRNEYSLSLSATLYLVNVSNNLKISENFKNSWNQNRHRSFMMKYIRDELG